MENYYFIGIDISKRHLDCCLLCNGNVIKQDVIVNHPKSIERYLSEICLECCVDPNSIIICAEYTGMYIYPLTVACQSKNYKLWMEDPTPIKYSSGLQRGKNDKIDARRIALYAFRYYDRMKVYQCPSVNIDALKLLSSELKMLCSDRKKYQSQLTDQKEYMTDNIYKMKSKRLLLLIKHLDKAIDAIETEMEETIADDDQLSHQMKLMLSIEGIGRKTALKMILET